MCRLEVNIQSAQKNYPIFINNHDIELLRDEILNTLSVKNYIVVISQKVFKIYDKILGFPKDKIFVLKDVP